MSAFYCQFSLLLLIFSQYIIGLAVHNVSQRHIHLPLPERIIHEKKTGISTCLFGAIQRLP
jgi:hypothetical protein